MPDYGRRLRAGIEVGDLTITVSEEERIDTDLDADQLLAFVTSESEALLYHATESMFRVYLAHLAHTPCPWLEMVSSMNAGHVREAVASRFGAEADAGVARRELERSFRLDGVDRTAVAADEFERAVGHLHEFFRALAERFIHDHSLYNAVKHGLTMIPSEAYVAFHDDDGSAIFAHSGPSLEYLTTEPWTKGPDRHRQWVTTTAWVDLVTWWSLTEAAVEIIRSVWTVGRRLRIGPQDGDYIWLPVDHSPGTITRATGSSGRNVFNRNLFVEFKK